jgi:hypothetical protein
VFYLALIFLEPPWQQEEACLKTCLEPALKMCLEVFFFSTTLERRNEWFPRAVVD